MLDYRYMDAHNITPRFEFGFGLSFTKFAYSQLEIDASGSEQVIITFSVTNTGSMRGTEIPQLYLGFPPSAGEPRKVLRGFEEVVLGVGDSGDVVMRLGGRDMRWVLRVFGGFCVDCHYVLLVFGIRQVSHG